jgi:serine/threonine protein kinase
MSPETCEPKDREELVNLVIYDFHEAIERGESPDPAEWVARYPEIAPELNAYFNDLAWLGLVRPSARGAVLSTTAPWPQQGAYGPQSRSQIVDLQPGDLLGDYVLLEKLGEGGQGIVWKAHPRRQRDIMVALKTLRSPAMSDPRAVHQLHTDAGTIARMKHAHIIRTSYLGEDRGRWFFTMELMDGTVADRLESYKGDPRSAAVLMEKIARAIHHAHTRNPSVIHLDLKPGNILLTADGEPKVTDFGLAVRVETIDRSGLGAESKRSGGADAADDVWTTLARAGIVGTIPFMSPEMAAGRWSDVSTASDVYGL